MPVIVLAVETPQAGWVLLPALGKPSQLIPAEIAAAVIAQNRDPVQGIWQRAVVEQNPPEERVSWFIGGTFPSWEGIPLAITVILEDDNPALAEEIGRSVLRAAMLP